MRDLTPRQRQILMLIQKVMNDTGMPPTRAEIARTLKFRSANAAEEHLRALERKGAISEVWKFAESLCRRGIVSIQDPYEP